MATKAPRLRRGGHGPRRPDAANMKAVAIYTPLSADDKQGVTYGNERPPPRSCCQHVSSRGAWAEHQDGRSGSVSGAETVGERGSAKPDARHANDARVTANANATEQFHAHADIEQMAGP